MILRLHLEEEFSSDKVIEVFKEIDVNGDQKMEWEEFTRFLSEKAGVFHKRNSQPKKRKKMGKGKEGDSSTEVNSPTPSFGPIAEYREAFHKLDRRALYAHRNPIGIKFKIFFI